MFIKSLFIIALSLITVLAAPNYVEKAFIDNQIVPDVLTTPPEHFLQVNYSNLEANLGNELTPTQVSNLPEVSCKNATSDAFHTLIMVDPDAPSRMNPTLREVQHWLVMNIPGNDIARGETINEYMGSAPPNGTSLHRYVLMMFKQTGKLDVDDEPHHSADDDGRINFSTMQFAEKYELNDAICGNFFQAIFEE